MPFVKCETHEAAIADLQAQIDAIDIPEGADGSETKIVDSLNLIVSGTGTAADPYSLEQKHLETIYANQSVYDFTYELVNSYTMVGVASTRVVEFDINITPTVNAVVQVDIVAIRKSTPAAATHDYRQRFGGSRRFTYAPGLSGVGIREHMSFVSFWVPGDTMAIYMHVSMGSATVTADPPASMILKEWAPLP